MQLETLPSQKKKPGPVPDQSTLTLTLNYADGSSRKVALSDGLDKHLIALLQAEMTGN